jgi:hypothetical protein
MSEEKEVTVKEPKAQKLSLSLDELQQIVVAAVTAATQASASTNAETLAAVVSETRKPVVDPRAEEDKRMMGESTRKQRERDAENMRLSQESCPHRQGSNQLSSFQGPLSSFVIHVLDTDLMVAICTNCLKTIFGDTDDPAEKKLFREKSGNQASAAGRRFFRDPGAAMKAGRS